MDWRERVALEKRKSFADQEYWGKPVPNFGDTEATHLIVGLAPAAHGANRTGRMFTGDRSGDWLYRALHKAGVANQSTATALGDGLVLRGVLITAVCHCAPPDNKPLPEEIANCGAYLVEALESRRWHSILCLGGLAYARVGKLLGRKLEPFSHGVINPGEPEIVGCYHPSQQNTFTGRLTEAMLDEAIRSWLE